MLRHVSHLRWLRVARDWRLHLVQCEHLFSWLDTSPTSPFSLSLLPSSEQRRPSTCKLSCHKWSEGFLLHSVEDPLLWEKKPVTTFAMVEHLHVRPAANVEHLSSLSGSLDATAEVTVGNFLMSETIRDTAFAERRKTRLESMDTGFPLIRTLVDVWTMRTMSDIEPISKKAFGTWPTHGCMAAASTPSRPRSSSVNKPLGWRPQAVLADGERQVHIGAV